MCLVGRFQRVVLALVRWMGCSWGVYFRVWVEEGLLHQGLIRVMCGSIGVLGSRSSQQQSASWLAAICGLVKL
jgi:hypothetical protein